ncbi:cytochrome P450, putative [Talaromyces stipitatus ATCC 10500]|uniref:Cytochrome P450, putative n=1 Tax=Talaromyces stipitatus (strain ATCC 10500 / CBS 375.48 / QM 6759 / NRRL 1006) TaxID=441959 RepID=B8M6V5_TALSN|nr:cytochrome P450, putative [Talaromyces stipitatus ATCC 10500]EED20175.1 cytochrome P450, putative [Talaromyces stipitatus ATCC 10500]
MIFLRILAAAISGALAFITYFHHGEHHLHGARYFMQFLVICSISTAYLTWIQGHNLSESLQATFRIATSFLTGLCTTCILYRLSPIHPLHKFPGPPNARISTLWLFFQVLKRKQAHLTLLAAHKEYGPIVRIGSNHLSIVHPRAVEKIHLTCRKAPFYDLNKPITSIQTARDKALHDQRRRLWSMAFTETRLRDYETSIKKIHKHLLARIDRDSKDKDGRPNRPINATRLINHYAFDVMGEVAYGTHFDMLATGNNHQAIDLLNEAMAMIGFMLPIWLIRVAVAIPGLTRKWWQFVAYCFEQMEICRSSKTNLPFIASSLLGPCKDRDPTPDEKLVLQGEAQLLVVAGSDTTSAALTCALYELVLHPQITTQLREAISASLQPGDTEVSACNVQNLDILNGIINETLRLYPPIPTTLWRLTPADGIWIDEETYIPGNVVVSTPHYVLGRSNNIYERPYDFIPERWYSKPKMVKYAKAFAPFTIGK